LRAGTVAGLYSLVSPIMEVSPMALTASMIAAISSALIAIGTAEYRVWPSPQPPPLVARPYTLTLLLSKPGSSPRLPFRSIGRRGRDGRGDRPRPPASAGRPGRPGDEGVRLPRLGARRGRVGHQGAGAGIGGGVN
jgi:hypothetical protein